MVQMDFGVTVRPTPHGGTLAEMTRTNARILAAARAHDLSCWVIDHLQFGADPILECLAFLAYHAGQVPGLRWGTLVLGQRYRHPALTAKVAATLQHLTGGRFILGLGAGDAAAEHRAYGYPFPPARVRVAQLDEAARIVTALWRGGPVTFTGAHYRVEGARCLPAPEPPPTLLIGGGGERRTLRLVARYADWWCADIAPVEVFTHKARVLRDHCAAVGRDPATIRKTYPLTVYLARTRAEAELRAGHRLEGNDPPFAGEPAALRDRLLELSDLGFDLFQLVFAGFPETDDMRLFVDEVLPAFRQS